MVQALQTLRKSRPIKLCLSSEILEVKVAPSIKADNTLIEAPTGGLSRRQNSPENHGAVQKLDSFHLARVVEVNRDPFQIEMHELKGSASPPWL
jgi:hypothetical protein